MLICSNCGHQNADGLARCERCNTVLRKDDTVLIPSLQDRERMVNARRLRLVDTDLEAISPLILIFQNEEKPEQITLQPGAKRYLVGRSEDQNVHVDVDLVPYNARQLGISRRHAVIYLKEGNWVVEDLESKNGTYLNSARLHPREAYPLNADDRLQFAHVTVNVQFEEK